MHNRLKRLCATYQPARDGAGTWRRDYFYTDVEKSPKIRIKPVGKIGFQNEEDLPNVARRKLLKGLAFSMPALWLIGGGLIKKDAYATVTEIQPAPDDFMWISRLLTGHENIAEELADGAWSALVQRKSNFNNDYASLTAAIAGAGVSKFGSFSGSPIEQNSGLKATAIDIVSAWYLGRVGKVESRSDNASTFITFNDALMWRPTIDVTVIPTYSRGGPGYWAKPPHGVKHS